ncbi:hypothetical protein BC628DRAFT_534567 [Trametes gibbosa]|nr:hypothetical protein BC628DRAFT_534567 [Trametes gibbosa]
MLRPRQAKYMCVCVRARYLQLQTPPRSCGRWWLLSRSTLVGRAQSKQCLISRVAVARFGRYWEPHHASAAARATTPPSRQPARPSPRLSQRSMRGCCTHRHLAQIRHTLSSCPRPVLPCNHATRSAGRVRPPAVNASPISLVRTQTPGRGQTSCVAAIVLPPVVA